MEHQADISPAPLKPAIVRFSVVFVGTAVALGLITTLLDFDAPTGTGAVVLFCAAYFAVAKFIEEHRRMPTLSEKRTLLWRTWLIATLLQLMILPLLAAGLSKGLMVFVVIFVCLLTWATLAFAYSDRMTGRLLAAFEKREMNKRSKWR